MSILTPTALPPLLPHQPEAVEFLLSRRRAYLADDPGLGKTIEAAYAWVRLGYPPLCVLCPAIAVPMWERVLRLAHPLGALGTDSLDVRVLSYDTAKRRPGLAFDITPEHVLILDEAHAFAHGTSQRTKFVLGRGGLAKIPHRVWLLSGTPMPKHPANLWPVLQSLFAAEVREWADDPHLSYEKFVDATCSYMIGEYGIKVFGVRDADHLKRLLFDTPKGRPLMLRRTAESVGLALPSLTWERAPLSIDAPALVETMAAHVPALGRAPQPDDPALATVRRELGLAKVEPYLRIRLAEFHLSPDPRVIFAHHVAVVDRLVEALSSHGHRVGYITGSTPSKVREASIAQFQAGELDDMVLGIMAAQTAITLTAACDVDILEPSWNADHNVQAAKRVHRISQDRPVTVRLFTMAGTLDDALIAQHVREARMQAQVFDTELLAPAPTSTASAPTRRSRSPVSAQDDF